MNFNIWVIMGMELLNGMYIQNGQECGKPNGINHPTS
jgi:hypothetical protein